MRRIRFFLLFSISGMLLPVTAVPTAEQISAAEPVVKALLEDVVAAFKSGKKTRADVAKTCLGYLDDAESEAAKFVLIRMAFRQYMSGGEFALAAEAFGHLNEAVPDMPNGTLSDWAKDFIPQICKKGRADGVVALLKCSLDMDDDESAASFIKQVGQHRSKLMKSKDWDRLKELMSLQSQRASNQKALRQLRASVKKSPDDAALRERLGNALVACDDWKHALVEFSKASGKLAEVAVWENTYPSVGLSELTTAGVADFWWTYSEDGQLSADAARSIRRHAAGWYQKSLDNNVLKGLKKALAEKRIREVETEGTVAEVGSSSDGSKRAMAMKSLKLPLGKRMELELVPCPAGTFEMGYPYGAAGYKPHKVKISSPFWMGKCEVTREQWAVIMGDNVLNTMNEIDMVCGGAKAAVVNVSYLDCEEFCRQVGRKCARLIPRGYVLRLPTEAEWEYACRANSTDENDPYYKPNGPPSYEEYKKIAATRREREELCKAKGLAIPERMKWCLAPAVVGQKKPNAFGLFDMLGNVHELTYDTFSRQAPDGSDRRGGQEFQFSPDQLRDSVDPCFTSDEKAFCITRGQDHGWGMGKKTCPCGARVPVVGFRVAVAPDLTAAAKSRRR